MISPLCNNNSEKVYKFHEIGPAKPGNTNNSIYYSIDTTMASLINQKTASMHDLGNLGEGMTDALMAQFQAIQKKTFREQAVWYMNGFWCDGANFSENPEEREKMWNYVVGMEKLHKDGAAGNELDEFKAHQFLEKSDMHMTVAKMRAVMKEIDLDFNKSISMSEFLIFHYKSKMIDLINAPQAADPAAAKRIAAAKVAVNAAKVSCDAAIASEQESQKAAKAAHAAEEAAKAALADLEAQQKALDDAKSALRTKIDDASLSNTKKSKAMIQLKGLESKDPLPLDRAKITQGAAVRKLAKAKKKAVKAAALATEALNKAQEDMATAEQMLNAEVKKSTGGGQGELWWMQRELAEAKKFMSPAALRKLEKKQAAEAAAAGESKD